MNSLPRETTLVLQELSNSFETEIDHFRQSGVTVACEEVENLLCSQMLKLR